MITPDTPLYDGGVARVGGVSVQERRRRRARRLALRQALTVSSDVFFYRLGLQTTRRATGC